MYINIPLFQQRLSHKTKKRMSQCRSILWVVIVCWSLVKGHSLSAKRKRRALIHVFLVFQSIKPKHIALQSSSREPTLLIMRDRSDLPFWRTTFLKTTATTTATLISRFSHKLYFYKYLIFIKIGAWLLEIRKLRAGSQVYRYIKI